jgi:membrane protease YdiL (CAAX protease family)
MVWARSAELNIRPFTGLVPRKTLVGAAEGFIVGGVGAALLFATIRVTVGRPVLDPSTALLTTQGNVLVLFLGIVLIAVAAPVVEEIVFRGFLAEAFRDRGKRVAVLVSALAFSLAHLRLSQFRYYLGMAILLAIVYWRRGLVGSITAHATFNGMLIVLAAAAAHGPALDVRTAGFTVAVPQTYHVSTDVFGEDLVAVGPLGAQIEFAHVDVDVPPARQLAGEMVCGQLPFPPELVVDSASVAVLPFPAGEAVSLNVSVEGRPGRMVALPRPGGLWIATVVSDGNHRTLVDFDRMLASWRIT